MTDFGDSSGASLRLSNDERERAVAALQSHAGQGRLSEEEVNQRIAAARAAVTRGDLAPLFADLPGGVRLDGLPTAPQAPAPGPGAYGVGDGGYGYGGYNGYGHAPQREPRTRWGLILVSVMPFVSVILFFLTGNVWGYQYSWLWFLLIPLTGALAYGVDGPRRR